MNDDIFELLKYLASKLLAGAMLFNEKTDSSLMVTTVELYGRALSIDPHCENPDVSIPPKFTRYKKVWPMTVKTSDGAKLIIGTEISNFLVTGSIHVDSKAIAEVGPSTLNLKLETEEASFSTLIFLDKKVYEAAKEIGEDADCDSVDVAHSLYQLLQIRSKMNEPETYYRLYSTFDMFNTVNEQPLTIFTLCNKRKTIESNGANDPVNDSLASKPFMNIAGEVLSRKLKARLSKDSVESIMLRFKNNTHKIPNVWIGTQQIINFRQSIF